jgi:hypothetical protein
MGQAFAAADAIYVWPRPTHTVSVRGGTARVHRQPGVPTFSHVGGCCAELLGLAFERYERIIYWADADAEMPAHLRARAPGLRETADSLELARCGGGGGGGGGAGSRSFGGLGVHVRSRAPTPLQLGVDESYSLRLGESGGTLSSNTEWGALRGLETFAQLVHWAGPGAGHLLCGLPLV